MNTFQVITWVRPELHVVKRLKTWISRHDFTNYNGCCLQVEMKPEHGDCDSGTATDEEDPEEVNKIQKGEKMHVHVAITFYHPICLFNQTRAVAIRPAIYIIVNRFIRVKATCFFRFFLHSWLFFFN